MSNGRQAHFTSSIFSIKEVQQRGALALLQSEGGPGWIPVHLPAQGSSSMGVKASMGVNASPCVSRGMDMRVHDLLLMSESLPPDPPTSHQSPERARTHTWPS